MSQLTGVPSSEGRPVVVVARDRFYTSLDQSRAVPTMLEGCGVRVIHDVVHAEEDGDSAGRYVLISRGRALGRRVR
jgi:hypothetical protein